MNRFLFPAAGFGAAALVLGSVVPGWGGNGGETEAEARRGLAIAPMPLNLRGKDRELVGLGSYIVNAQAGCNDCHSKTQYAPGGDPYRGEAKRVDAFDYLRGGQSFGPFVSRNLRPELGSGLPAGLSYPQFLSVMRHGTDFDQAHPEISPLLQVMPWPDFQDMTDRDLRAVYEYLRSLPAVPPGG